MATEELQKSGRHGSKPSTDSEVKSRAESKVSDTNTIEETPTKPAPWRALFAFSTRRNLPILVAGIIVSILAGATAPALNLIVGDLFEGFTMYAMKSVTAEEFMKRETKYIIYVTAIAGASWLLHSLEFILWLAFGELQAACARDRLFHGLMAKETEWYDLRKNGIGAQLPRMQAQIRELQLATAQPLGSLFALASTAILSLVQAFVKSPKLTLVTLASTPVILALAVWAGRPMQINLIRMQDKLTEAQKYTTSAFTAIETVKCFNGQGIEANKYRSIINQAAVFYAWVAHGSALQMALVVMLSTSMFVQGFYYGGVLIAKGEVNSGDVVTTFFSAIGAFQAIQGILPQMIVLEKGRAAGATLRAIMAQVEAGSTSEESQEALKPATCIGNIEVKNLTFAYPSRSDVPAVQDITLYIQGGDISFLIGKSGSGKSTISQLLMRFYKAPEGTVTIDGIPLERLDTHWLRSNVTLVEQTSLLFNDSVFRNIAFGRHDHESVTRDEVLAAVQFALLQLMISDMPDGLETMVGVKGGAMSGGQRQRMALARARLRDTPILILDESTSALDHITRTLIMEALRNWRRGKTTIIITHDITQIMPGDYVYLLENGRLVQEGYRKQMEKAKGSPFQAFLSEEEPQSTRPQSDVKDLDFGDRDSRSSSASSVVGRPLPQHKASYLDPLDAELTATEQKRQSKLPNVFQEGIPIPVMRPYNQRGPNSPFASPWLRVATNFSPVDMPGLTWNRTPDLEPPDTTSPEEVVSDKRSSLAWEKLLDQTGKLAVDVRRAQPGIARNRRPLKDIEEIPLTGPDEALAALEGQRPNQVEAANKSYKVIFGTIWPNLNWRNKVYLFLGIWGATVHAVTTPVFSYILSKLLATYAIPGGQKSKSLIYALAILAVSVADAFHTYAFRFLLEWVGERWVDAIRTKAYERILDQDREFFNKKENGIAILTESLDRNAEEMRNLLGRFAALAYVAALMTLVAIIWALVSQWKITLIALCVAPYIFGVTKVFAAVAEKWEGRSNDASDKASAIFNETFTNIKTVRALTLEDHFLDKYTDATNEALIIGFKRSFFAGFFFGLSDSAGNFATAMIFYVGARVATDGVNINDIVTVFAMLIFTITNVSAILEYIPQIGSSTDTAARLLRLAQLPKVSHEHLGDTRITSIGEIVLENLKFSYPSRPDQTILKNINLRLRPSTTTAIVGGSGSGKSTIANLLLDLYSTSALPLSKPTDLTLGGRSIQHISTPSLRALIVPVSQTPTLFAATAAENIAYGLPSNHAYNTAANIAFAARQAGVHDFILSLPQGYDTPIGEGGLGLSGGQAQRIAIARALVRKPSVLILDEATSALDIETANLIRQTIAELIAESKITQSHAHASSMSATQQPVTIIIITHHRSMMEIAERVVVLDEGRIVEEGPFGELIGRKGGALRNLLSGGEWMEGDGEGGAGEEESRRENRSRSEIGMRKKRRSGAPVLRDVDWGAGRRGGKGKERARN